MREERSESAATKMHLWLERTAFYKVPKSHQDEVSDECQKPFDQVCFTFCFASAVLRRMYACADQEFPVRRSYTFAADDGVVLAADLELLTYSLA